MHDGIEHAGYLAFLGLLSFFPFMVFFVAMAGFMGQSQIGEQFVAEILSKLPEYLLNGLKPRIDEIVSGPPQGLMTLAIIGVIWTASSAVEGTRTILNRAYRVETPPAYIWRRLMSIVQFLVLTLAIILTMLGQIFGPGIWAKVKELLDVQETVFDAYGSHIHLAITSIVFYLAIAVTYYTLPNIKQKWINVAPGALIVVIGWIGAANLLAAYISNFNQLNLVYGSLGGIIVSLLFFYIIGVIYIFGAEFNYFFERSIGHKFVEKEKTKPHTKAKD